MTKPHTALDVDQTYYTLKFLYERVQWDNKSQSERNQAMYDLAQYTSKRLNATYNAYHRYGI